MADPNLFALVLQKVSCAGRIRNLLISTPIGSRQMVSAPLLGDRLTLNTFPICLRVASTLTCWIALLELRLIKVTDLVLPTSI